MLVELGRGEANWRREWFNRSSVTFEHDLISQGILDSSLNNPTSKGKRCECLLS